MLPLLSAGRKVLFFGFLGSILTAQSQAAFAPQGGEFRTVESLPGDQVFPRLAINASGGYIVWHDNNTDGDGLGIMARRLDSSLSGTLAPFKVNEVGIGDQEFPRVALLKNGGAVFAWQGGAGPTQRIYARFVRPDGTFATGDVLANTYQLQHQINPAVAGLANGTGIIVWSSYGQDGSLYGVFGQRFSPLGEKLGSEFRVNLTTQNNQRTPALVSLPNGGFLVVWISEAYRATVQSTGPEGTNPDGSGGLSIYDVDAYGRMFDSEGLAQSGEFRINSSRTTCANPAVSINSDGGFIVTWSGKPNVIVVGTNLPPEGWDIYGRTFGANGLPRSADFRVNTFTFGDQYLPNVANVGDSYMVVWTSLNQDGSREGVYAQVVDSDGAKLGDEFRVNSTTVSQQIYPAVAADGEKRFVVAWSSFVGGLASFDLFAQRYSSTRTLVPPATPYVSALSQTRLSVTWPEVAGYDIVQYELSVDDGSSSVLVTNTFWTVSGLAPNSLHTFRLAYRLTDGSRSPWSEEASGRTWGEDGNFDGLPDDWQTKYWGADPQGWGSASADSDGDGGSNLQEFLAGTDPTNPNSVLRTTIISTSLGYRLSWDTQPGLIYEVQVSEDLRAWTSVGLARFALTSFDSIGLVPARSASMYRIIRLR